MLLFKSLLFFISTALAVDVLLFIVDSELDCSDDDDALICTDIGIGVCCMSSAVTDFPSAQVQGLSPQPNDGNIGIAFETSSNNACGTACDSAFSVANPCLVCDDNISGAGWNLIPVRKERSTESLSACTSSVLADKLRYKGRLYNIYHDVPEDISAELINMAKNNTKLADIPERFSGYEAKGT